VTKAEAKQHVVRLFREWAATHGKPLPYDSSDGGLSFFYWLERNHADALRFRSRADKWQLVHGWLLQAGLVTR